VGVKVIEPQIKVKGSEYYILQWAKKVLEGYHVNKQNL